MADELTSGATGGELTGRLLVATPSLDDPNFTRSVVLVLGHSDADGALGLVLNRPSPLPVEEVLPSWAAKAAPPATVFVGGPVSEGSAVALGLRSRRVPASGAEPGEDSMAAVLGGAIDTVDLSLDGAADTSITKVRIFSGYAGWGAAQLELEITLGSWYVVEPELDDVFAGDPETLWRSVLRRQPGQLAWVSTCPEDPTLN